VNNINCKNHVQQYSIQPNIYYSNHSSRILNRLMGKKNYPFICNRFVTRRLEDRY
jgi:hypothetical protein